MFDMVMCALMCCKLFEVHLSSSMYVYLGLFNTLGEGCEDELLTRLEAFRHLQKPVQSVLSTFVIRMRQ